MKATMHSPALERRLNGEAKPTRTEEREVLISAPNLQTLEFHIVGIAPYVQARFSEKARKTMSDKMTGGKPAQGKKNREPRNFDEDYRQAMHKSSEGWCGIPASAFRAGMISACRLVDFKMTLAKLTVFVLADGFDHLDGAPLIKIEGEPEKCEHMVRNATGVSDIRVRAMWRQWSAVVRVRYDADRFTREDIANLMHRVGSQVGIGEGRPDSRSSAGMGWGLFTFKSQEA